MWPLALLLALAPLAPATVADGAELGCAPGPPCGEINPRLLLDLPELTREPFVATAGDVLVYEGTITYWFDMDDEGYSPYDPEAPIEIQISFPRLPPWAQMTAEPSQIAVDMACADCLDTSVDNPDQPQVHYAFAVPLTVTLEILAEPERTPGYDYGKLQLFAKSSESGIYNPGFGIKEFRVLAEGADDGMFGAPAPAVVLVLAAVAVAAWTRRQKK